MIKDNLIIYSKIYLKKGVFDEFWVFFVPKSMNLMLKTGTLFGMGHYSRLGHYSNNYGTFEIPQRTQFQITKEETCKETG